MEGKEHETRDLTSLILYLECCAVDDRGLIDGRRMNKTDMDISREWNDRGFIQFGRVAAREIEYNKTHWVVLSKAAWATAHRERLARAERGQERITVHRNGFDD